MEDEIYRGNKFIEGESVESLDVDLGDYSIEDLSDLDIDLDLDLIKSFFSHKN